MNTRPSWVLGVCFLVGCLILAVAFGPRSQAEPGAAPQAGQPNRYEMRAVQSGRSSVLVTVMDRQTGQCWIRAESDNAWKDLGTPARPRRDGK
jgi:hypothetical protein